MYPVHCKEPKFINSKINDPDGFMKKNSWKIVRGDDNSADSDILGGQLVPSMKNKRTNK